MRRTLLVGGGVLACATAATILGTSPSGDEILFPHERHKQAKVECITCHHGVPIPRQLTDILTDTLRQKGSPAAIAQFNPAARVL